MLDTSIIDYGIISKTDLLTVKVNFIGIGAQKCASTWIHRVLSDHPEVTIYSGKQIDFFSFFYDRGYQWYEKQLQESGKVAIGEFSTSYFTDSDSPERVFSYNPGMRIILSLRDPIDRAYSNHLHEVRLQHITGRNLTFETGLKNNPMYLLQSRYSLHLKRWLEIFPASQLLVLFQEEIRDTPLEQSRKLYRFLGLDDSHHSKFLKEKINKSQISRHQGFERFARYTGQLGRALGAGSIIESVKKNKWLRRLRQYNEVDLRDIIPAIQPSTREYLQSLLADDMFELSRQLNRTDIPWPTWRSLNDDLKKKLE
ncbi:Sulfotransferase domain-containing protein [Nitrosomonas marina]|uniref:Sulfotransferase domain-containing protein n=1 Tax=Nitrosomonas marina TaxID=917 RepID=A0A1I0ET55_9PROT|nr:sulfotransferase [Nitrosomonas marina]SET48742.1 Sulfotransferase domain-containing protein [Nitrosomonas marina]